MSDKNFNKEMKTDEVNASERKQRAQKLKNTISLKRNVYAVIISVIFIVAVILVNVFSTAMAVRYPLELDLTNDKLHSMSQDNVDFIKSIEKKVNIYVCLTEDEYNCSAESSYNMAYFAAQQYFVDYNSYNAAYFMQSAELLDKYARYNDNISLIYLDMNEPESALITADFNELEWSTGDILIECITEDASGKESARRTAVVFDDIYTLKAGPYTEQAIMYSMMDNYALYGAGVGYTITENNIELAVSAAIYKVVSDNTPKFLVPTAYYPVINTNSIILDEYLKKTLTVNNYELDYAEGLISNILSEKNFDEYAGIILAGCERDLSSADYEVIVDFLDNKGKKGKSLLYFAGIDVVNKMPRLCALLGEWGIGYGNGIVYETSTSNRVMTDEKGDPTEFLHLSTETDYTKHADGKGYYAVGNSVPMSVLFGNNTTATYSRTTEVLMRTGGYGTTTIMPLGEDAKTWKPSDDATFDAYPSIILAKDEMTQENLNIATSYIVAFSTTDFIANEWVANYSTVVNDYFTLDVFNAVSGMTENPFNFIAKTITSEKFVTRETNQLTVKIIFMAVIPVLIVGTGITVWVVRKRK